MMYTNSIYIRSMALVFEVDISEIFFFITILYSYFIYKNKAT